MLMLLRKRAFQCAFIFGGTMHHHNQYKEQSTFFVIYNVSKQGKGTSTTSQDKNLLYICIMDCI